MVALSGVAPPAEQAQVARVVEVVLPGADIAHPRVGVAREQIGRLALGYDGNPGLYAAGKALLFDGAQRGVLVAVGTRDRVIEYPMPVVLVADDQTPRHFRPVRLEFRAPHEFRAQRILAEFVVAPGVVAPQTPGVALCHRFERYHKSSSFFPPYYSKFPENCKVFSRATGFRARRRRKQSVQHGRGTDCLRVVSR